jgi:hypothetical protein
MYVDRVNLLTTTEITYKSEELHQTLNVRKFVVHKNIVVFNKKFFIFVKNIISYLIIRRSQWSRGYFTKTARRLGVQECRSKAVCTDTTAKVGVHNTVVRLYARILPPGLVCTVP